MICFLSPLASWAAGAACGLHLKVVELDCAAPEASQFLPLLLLGDLEDKFLCDGLLGEAQGWREKQHRVPAGPTAVAAVGQALAAATAHLLRCHCSFSFQVVEIRAVSA